MSLENIGRNPSVTVFSPPTGPRIYLRKYLFSFENLGRQVQSWFGGRPRPHHPQRRQRGGAGGLEAREERLGQFQEGVNLQHKQDTEGLLEGEEEEDIGL